MNDYLLLAVITIVALGTQFYLVKTMVLKERTQPALVLVFAVSLIIMAYAGLLGKGAGS